MSVRLWTKWLCVRVQLQSLKLEISCLLRVRSSWHSGNYLVWIHSNAYMTWQEHTVNFYLFFKRPATWKIFVLKVFSCFYICYRFYFCFFCFYDLLATEWCCLYHTGTGSMNKATFCLLYAHNYFGLKKLMNLFLYLL